MAQYNAPFSNTRSVAELVLGEIIMLVRNIPKKNAMLHRGGRTKSAAHSYEVRGKTLGIIGYGHIGTQIGGLTEQLGMAVISYDIDTNIRQQCLAIERLERLCKRLRRLQPAEGLPHSILTYVRHALQ